MSNDMKKTIEDLGEISEYFGNCRSNASFGSKAEEHFWELQSAANGAVELLKKREPKPVIVKTNAYDHRNYYCPKCGVWFEYAYRKPNYCDRCGQAVKWE